MLVIFRQPTLYYICNPIHIINYLMISNLSRYSTTLILLLFVIAAGSCKKDDSKDEDISTNVPAKLTANIDGDAFTATTIALDNQDGLYTLSGLAAGNKTLTLVFNTTSEGTYPLTFDEVSMLYSVGAIAWTGGPSASGTITITDNANGKLKGTFQAVLDELIFTGTSVSIASGVFEGIAY
jgi:hypothetical protein